MLEGLDEVVQSIAQEMSELDAAREEALKLSREVIRSASVTIKHVHRGEIEAAREGLEETAGIVRKMLEVAAPWGLLRHARFVLDAEKEYCEAAIVVAAIADEEVPRPEQMGVDSVAWINGLAEAVGELRRHVLDLIRFDKLQEAERFLELMEDIYYHVLSFDLPDAITGGLRGRTDQARGAVERTRGELTMAIEHGRLAELLRRARKDMGEGGSGGRHEE